MKTSTKCHALGYATGVIATYMVQGFGNWGIILTVVVVMASLQMLDRLGWSSPS